MLTVIGINKRPCTELVLSIDVWSVRPDRKTLIRFGKVDVVICRERLYVDISLIKGTSLAGSVLWQNKRTRQKDKKKYFRKKNYAAKYFTCYYLK
jgi:hypothetical protein